jgi:hypothetical protein
MITTPLGDADLEALLGVSQKLLEGLNPGLGRCELPVGSRDLRRFTRCASWSTGIKGRRQASTRPSR